MNSKVPSGAVVESVYPVFKNSLTNSFSDIVVTNIKNLKDFGVSYDYVKQTWRIITADNLNITGSFSLAYQNDTTGTNLDDSWLIRFSFQNTGYLAYYRGVEYVFHSVSETTFYFDNKTKIYDTKSGSVIRDQIKLLKSNSKPDSASPLGQDQVWHIYRSYLESDGYVNRDRIYVTYADNNGDGLPDNPELFRTLVNPTNNVNTKLVFFRSVNSGSGFFNLVAVDNRTVVTIHNTLADITSNKNLYQSGQVFYAVTEKAFYVLDATRSLVAKTDYIAKLGRQDLAYQYRHNSPNDRRIDPSCTNVIDLYMLTSTYEGDYRRWIQDTTSTVAEPIPPTTQELSTAYAALNDIRSVSDTIVFNSAKFKPLFGKKAATSLQATFKVIKNPTINTSDNDIRVSVVNAINTYFDINNWDFGETFYFSELSAYLHQALSPNVASILIVPVDPSVNFGSLYQINAEPYEIIVSAATVDNVEIITSVTAAQLNLTAATLNTEILI